jgi:hypothetical protein
MLKMGMLLAVLIHPWDIRRLLAEEASQPYAALEKAVLDGKDIHMILDLSICKLEGTGTPAPPDTRTPAFRCLHDPKSTDCILDVAFHS